MEEWLRASNASETARCRPNNSHRLIAVLIAPMIKDLAEQYGDRVKIVKMDIDANPGTPGKYGIRAIPTILAFKNGEVVEQLQGARPKADFEAQIKNLL